MRYRPGRRAAWPAPLSWLGTTAYCLSKAQSLYTNGLLEAAERGDAGRVRTLLEGRADSRLQDYQLRTPLHVASHRGYLDVVRVLLAFHAEVDARDARRRPALHLATEAGHLRIVRILLNNFATPDLADEEGGTPLHAAARLGQAATAAALLHHGAEVALTDVRGRTPIHTAAGRGQANVIRLLAASRAPVAVRDVTGCTPLCLATFGDASAPTVVMVVQLLLGLRGTTEGCDTAGRTPLHWAAMAGHDTVATVLLESGADAEARDTEGNTALAFAITAGHTETSAALLRASSGVHSGKAYPSATPVMPLVAAVHGSPRARKPPFSVGSTPSTQGKVTSAMKIPPPPLLPPRLPVSLVVPGVANGHDVAAARTSVAAVERMPRFTPWSRSGG